VDAGGGKGVVRPSQRWGGGVSGVAGENGGGTWGSGVGYHCWWRRCGNVGTAVGHWGQSLTAAPCQVRYWDSGGAPPCPLQAAQPICVRAPP